LRFKRLSREVGLGGQNLSSATATQLGCCGESSLPEEKGFGEESQSGSFAPISAGGYVGQRYGGLPSTACLIDFKLERGELDHVSS
jgi:hypothetical protein